MANNLDLQLRQEQNRFWIATLLIGGFLILIAISLLMKYSTPEVLSGIFGAWILAIVGFYFQQQNVDNANKRAKDTVDQTTLRLNEIRTKVTRATDQMKAANMSRMTKSLNDAELTSRIDDIQRQMSEVLDDINRPL